MPPHPTSVVKTYKGRLLCIFLSSKFVLVLLALFSAYFFEPYNSSLSLLLNAEPPISVLDARVKTLLRPFAHWDGSYFVKIAVSGYVYEQQHAFLPLYPVLIRIVADGVLAPFRAQLSLLSRCLIAGVLASNVLHAIAVRLLFQLTQHVFANAYFSFVAAAFFAISPASVYLSAVYSESLFSLLAILGLVFFYSHRRVLAAVAWFLAGLTRSNGTLLGAFFGYELLQAWRHSSSLTVAPHALQLCSTG